LASEFNRDASSPDAPPPAGEVPAQVAETPAVSPAAQRFKTCRWQQPSEDGSLAFCTHREVKPYAGAATFDPEAWCGDCQYYKLRRVPKKRVPNEDWGY
jgi:hypothetical protein